MIPVAALCLFLLHTDVFDREEINACNVTQHSTHCCHCGLSHPEFGSKARLWSMICGLSYPDSMGPLPFGACLCQRSGVLKLVKPRCQYCGSVYVYSSSVVFCRWSLRLDKDEWQPRSGDTETAPFICRFIDVLESSSNRKLNPFWRCYANCIYLFLLLNGWWHRNDLSTSNLRLDVYVCEQTCSHNWASQARRWRTESFSIQTDRLWQVLQLSSQLAKLLFRASAHLPRWMFSGLF